MKILQVGTGAIKMPPKKYGGVELYIYSTSKHMAQEGHSVTIADIKESSADPEVEQIDSIRFIRFSIPQVKTTSRNFIISYVLSRIGSVIFAIKVGSYIRKNHFDIIHLHSTLIGLILTFLNRKLRSRMVYTVHSPSWFMPSLGRLERLALNLDYSLIRRVRKVIAVTRFLEERLIALGKDKPGNLVVIHEGVETSKFTPNIGIGRLRERYGLKEQEIILFVGRVVPYKGVEYLVKASDIIINHFGYSKVFFLLVGPLAEYQMDKVQHSEYISKLFSFIKDHGLEDSVKFTGAMPFDDLPEFFSGCDIFVLPSLAETFGLVISQAMASAKPIIGTQIAGILDQIKDGWNGYLVEPANEYQLAEKIKFLVDHPEERKRMGLNGRKLAEEEFDWSQVSARLLQVYETMLENVK